MQDLFGERAHERIIMEAIPLLRIVTMTEQRLELILQASLNAHDQALRAAANSVLTSLCEVMEEKLVLHLLQRVHLALLEDGTAQAAFELLSLMVTMVKRERFSDKPLLMSSGVPVAEATLQVSDLNNHCMYRSIKMRCTCL